LACSTVLQVMTASIADSSGRPRVSRHDTHYTFPESLGNIQLQPHAKLRHRHQTVDAGPAVSVVYSTAPTCLKGRSSPVVGENPRPAPQTSHSAEAKEISDSQM
jgi:hypothetical protein